MTSLDALAMPALSDCLIASQSFAFGQQPLILASTLNGIARCECYFEFVDNCNGCARISSFLKSAAHIFLRH